MEKVILAILDGFGIGDDNPNTNAIYAANPPFLKKLWTQNEYGKLAASETEVGLKKNQFGNSELGHMTIGSGTTILGIDEIFNKKIENDEIDNFLLNQEWVKDALNSNNTVHICGMYSDGCVHSNATHFKAIIDFFQKRKKKIGLHLISDGRDTKPNVFLDDLIKLRKRLDSKTKIISIGGRYYGMDRDGNFERTKFYFDAMMSKNPGKNTTVEEYIQSEYENKRDDEFIKPINFHVDENYRINENDTIVFLNYRADRIRQIIHMFRECKKFSFPSENVNVKIIGLCEYPDILLDSVIVQKQKIEQTLAKLLAKNNIKQLHIAETEKFAHVTFFFNAGIDECYKNQKNILIDSKKIPTYDLEPQMSADEITQTIQTLIEEYDFIVVNYANADMVGHTGNFEATKNAIKNLDKQCQLLYNLLNKYNGTLMITSDHGNADLMRDKHGDIVKTHSIAKVPLFVLSSKYKLEQKSGRLQDIAPSILYIYKIDKPKSMDGINLLTETN